MDPPTKNPQSIPTVLVVDADVSIHDPISTLIRSAGWPVRCFQSFDELRVHPCVDGPHCLVLDVSFPEIDGLDVVGFIAQRPLTPVICLTRRPDVTLAVRAIRAGAVEFLMKPFDPETLLAAVIEAQRRRRYELARDAELRGLKNRVDLLSSRERDVLTLVVEGRLNKQIAAELGIAEGTVKVHRGRVMNKMAARSLADLVKMSARLPAWRQPVQEDATSSIPIRRDGFRLDLRRNQSPPEPTRSYNALELRHEELAV